MGFLLDNKVVILPVLSTDGIVKSVEGRCKEWPEKPKVGDCSDPVTSVDAYAPPI